MKLKPRPYQARVLDDTRAALRRVKRVLIQLPTGGGKTVIAALIADGVVKRGNSLSFLCHRDFLVDQTSKTFLSNDIEHSFVAAGRWHNRFAPVTVCMIPTLTNRLSKVQAPKVAIWDECHHIGAKTWARIMTAWPDTIHIGLTATPVRLDGKGLDDYFDEMVIGPTIRELIEEGSLADYRAFAPSAPDLTGVSTRRGDYVKGEIDEVMDRSVLIGDMVGHYKKIAPGSLAVYFCSSVKHSQHVAASFCESGIPALHLDGNSSTAERMDAAQRFARREKLVLTNVDLFGEGYDLAAQAQMEVTIETVGLARPTQSLGLYMQQVGRSLRPKPHPAIILDHAGNISRHGLVDDEREWSLRGVEKDGSGGSTVKQCENCFAMYPISAKLCPECGVEKAPADGGGREVEQEDGDLEEIDVKERRKIKKQEEWGARTVDDLVRIAKQRGYKSPEQWAAHIWTARERAINKRLAGQMDFLR
ncbi:DEAD/DEAH box helicase [uncultured Paraglaciecola sp.]|uniref:DEAD/DEAH box helicase n=1 Tax=uncultured Paraglaciecola sp. TaxID=1765024 RepID=UPI00261256BB|nr:DEAD/DEAH box helicase [uncultured Paraglaciecola sp.]